MSSYAEDIICMAHGASGPSIRDMEVIRSFQSCPTTKDAVSDLFLFLYGCDFDVVFLEQDAHLFGSQGYWGIFVLPW
jgi:hypothetical protein